MNTDNYFIENKIYNSNLNNRLWRKVECKEVLTPEEEEYITYCYHCEEFRTYGEV